GPATMATRAALLPAGAASLASGAVNHRMAPIAPSVIPPMNPALATFANVFASSRNRPPSGEHLSGAPDAWGVQSLLDAPALPAARPPNPVPRTSPANPTAPSPIAALRGVLHSPAAGVRVGRGVACVAGVEALLVATGPNGGSSLRTGTVTVRVAPSPVAP